MEGEIFYLSFSGAEVFFPDARSRRDHLLSLVDEVMEDGKAVSLSYTFESLCRFFSNKDASGLLGLPEQKIPVRYLNAKLLENKYHNIPISLVESAVQVNNYFTYDCLSLPEKIVKS